MRTKMIGLNHEAIHFVEKLEEVPYRSEDIPTALRQTWLRGITGFDNFKPKMWKQGDIWWREICDTTPNDGNGDGGVVIYTCLKPYVEGTTERHTTYFNWVRNLNMKEGHIDWDKGQFNDGVKL